jgi:tetratricopeptide (TPR) repeat protein
MAGTILLAGTWVLVQLGLLGAGFPVTGSGRAAGGAAPKDWLLVADFESPASDPALALAFQTLLVRDLESAGYTSVVGGFGAMSRRGLEDMLARMRLPPEARVDPDLACDLAEREGAAGVLAGRVLPLGGEYVVVASILGMPGCGEQIRASASASFDELSVAVTAVSRELRARLGESRASIRGSPPLPPITAGYIQALRAISRYISTPTLWDDGLGGAAPLLEAIRVEPDLAFAHFLLALHYQRLGDYEHAVPHILRAHELRAQLPRPGRLGMEAIHQRYITSNPRAAMATVQGLVANYPALADATMPFLADAALWTGDWQRALDVSLAYLQRKPAGLGAHLGYGRAAAAAWALGHTRLADSLYQADARARRDAGSPPDRAEALLRLLRLADWKGAAALCTQQPDWDRCAWVYLARGQLDAATQVLAAMRADTASRPPWRGAAATAALAHIEVQRGRPERAWNVLESADHTMPMTGLARAGTHLRRFLLCAAASNIGRSPDLAECNIESENPATWDADPSFTVLLRSGAWSRRLLAVRSLERGDAARALSQLRDAVHSNFDNPAALDHLLLAHAFDALANVDSALVHYIAATRLERDCCFPTTAALALPLAPVYRRIGELAERRRDPATAQQYYGAFLDLWAEADPDLQPQVAAVRARLARLGSP